DLLSDLKSELSGKFETIVLALFEHPRIYDANECNKAISGVGTDEDALIEILSTRSNGEIKEIRDQYRRLFKRELERDIQADTSGDFKRLLTSLVTGNREERPQPDIELAKKEATELYKAGEKRLGTDEAVFNRILCLRSNAQLRETFDQYKALSGKDIEKSIQSEMSGNLEIGCLAIVRAARNTPAYFAERLHKSMAGAGTKDEALIRSIVSRAEVDMVAIKQEFNTMYGKTLASFVKGDTSGDYKKIILGLIGE
ncbi:Annexin, partial [Plakobranchus ocellatus]